MKWWCWYWNAPFSLPGFLVSALEMGQLKSLGGAEDSREFAQIPATNMQIKQTSKTLVGNLQQMLQACASMNSYFYGNWTERACAFRKRVLAVAEQSCSHNPRQDFTPPQRLRSTSWLLCRSIFSSYGRFSPTKPPHQWLFTAPRYFGPRCLPDLALREPPKGFPWSCMWWVIPQNSQAVPQIPDGNKIKSSS